MIVQSYVEHISSACIVDTDLSQKSVKNLLAQEMKERMTRVLSSAGYD